MKRLFALWLAGLLCLVLVACSGTAHQVHPAGWGGTPQGVTLPHAVYGGATAPMYDTVTLSTVPAHPFALAGYTSGFWPTYLPLRQTWPVAHTVSIAISASHAADCLDVEPGDAPTSDAGPWARADIRAGFHRPCLYSDLSNMPAVKSSLRAWLGSGWRAKVFLWLAWYRFRPGLVSGYDAVQYTDHALGRNLDESTASLAFLSIAQPPYVAPRPKPKPHPSNAVRIAYLRSLAHKHHCYLKHHRKPRECVVWGHEVEALSR